VNRSVPRLELSGAAVDLGGLVFLSGLIATFVALRAARR